MILGLIPVLTTNVPIAQAAEDLQERECNVLATTRMGFSPFCVFLHPGIADEYATGWSHTLGTLKGTEMGLTQRRQVFEKYLDYSIFASGSDSVGDLQFDFTIPVGAAYYNVSAIDIYVPPEFTFLGATPDESVWSDITNDYGFITVSTLNSYDRIAPNWNVVEVGAEGGWNMTAGIYHIRLLDLRAPEIAGLYFFKIGWWGSDGTQYVLSAADFPIVVVKTDLNPAWIEVTVRTNLHTAPPYTSGRVIAVGTTPEGRSVMGATYWGPMNFEANSTVPGNVGAEYKSWIFGLAAGTYTLTAEASGFLPTTTDRLTLDPGQSYNTYIVVYYSPEVSVTVWSKHGTGALPWHNLWQLPYGTNNPAADPNDNATWRDIMLELYDTNNNLIAFWASDVLGTNATPGWAWDGYFDLGLLGPTTHPGLSPGWLHGVTGTSKWIAATTKLLGWHDDEAPMPTAVSYSAKLCDNFDVLGNLRMYPSTHWDGHVPWSTADYIAGYANGDYTVEGFVTGYIMDEADAYQRAFSLVGSSMNLQFDLRRSNWLEVSMHLPANTVVSVPTTVTLTAEDAAAGERGAIAFLATTAMTADGFLDGLDATEYYNTNVALDFTNTVPTYPGGIVIEGWNAVFPNLKGKSGTRDLFRKDYGLNPTASTHSAGAVTLAGNPYTIKLYMADMGIPYNPPLDLVVPPDVGYGYHYWNATGWYSIVGGDPQASVYLCNSRVALSFSITNAWVEISLRSVDFEIPAHSRPWTFPGSEIYVDFTDTATGEVVDSLDPTIYGLFQDPGWLNATPATLGDHLYWAIPGVTYPGMYDHGLGWTPYDNDNVHLAGQHEHLWVPYFGTDYCSATFGGGYPIYRALLTLRSTRLPAGEYTFEAKTHGYIMRRSFAVQLPQSGVGDIEADLIQGGQIRVTVDFYHEGVPTGFHGFIYAEAFDSAGNFVGSSIYGQAQPNWYTRIAHGGGYLEYNGWPINTGDPSLGSGADWMVVQGPAQAAGLNFWNGSSPIDYQTEQQNALRNYVADEHYLLNCTDTNPAYPSCSYAQRAYWAWAFHSNYLGLASAPAFDFPWRTWADWAGWNPPYYSVPVDQYFPGNRVDMEPGVAQSMDIYGFYQYYGNAVRTWAGGWPVPAGGNSAGQADSGMKGSIDVPGWSGSGAGLYTVKVWAFDSRGPDNATSLDPTNTNTLDDWRMYAMGTELKDVQVPWGGAVELYVPMNNMATLTGTVRWFDMYGNLRLLPWAQVTASPGPSTDTYPAYQTSHYIMWLPAGTHDVSVSTSEAPQVWTSAAPTVNDAFTVVVSDGWAGGGDSQLSTSGTPVPEVPAFAAPLALFAVLAASVWLLRKKSYNIPVLMK
jgi:hypothetical protein